MSARVSVVIATRNRARLVGRAIASVRGQTAGDWELICVDDGSTDDTVDVIGAIAEPRLRLLRLPDHRGASRARNAGIEAARGEHVAFLDDDNEWVPQALAALVAPAADGPEGPRPDVVYGLTSRLNDATGRIAPPGRLMPGGDAFGRLLQGWNPMVSSLAVRRTALTAAGGFDDRLPAFEDYDLLLRLAADGARFAGVGRPVLIRHEHHGRGAISGNPERLRAALDALDAKWHDIVLRRAGRGAYRRWRARLASSVEFVAVRNAAAQGRRGQAWRGAARMARFLPWSVRFPALAAAAALLGPAGYDRVARVRDAMLRYGRR
jgi:glycosyltransferase involved in cell wall biosynthesis